MTTRHCMSDRGSIPILVATIAALLMLAVIAVQLGSAVVAKARAGGAADLAALAAVTQGCDVAASIAAANGARLVACGAAGADASGDVRVTVSVPMQLPPPFPDEVRQTARAGLG